MGYAVEEVPDYRKTTLAAPNPAASSPALTPRSPFEWLQLLARPKRAQRLRSVLTVEQVRRVLARMSGQKLLMAQLIYGTGMRIMQSLSLKAQICRKTAESPLIGTEASMPV